MGTGFSKRKKQARALHQQFSQMQDQLKDLQVVGKAGNGLVEIVLNGEHELKSVKINPECVDPQDVEGLQLLIKAAYSDAFEQLKKQASPSTIPGMPDLSQFGL